MNGRLTYGSLFSGVGGFDMGFDPYMDCVFQVEWDKHCQSILRRHWPEVPKFFDVQNVNGDEIPPCDVLIFGSPCQDLSVAGKRAGLTGEKSSMFFEATRIIKEMQNAKRTTTNFYPRVVVWENVPGAISSNGGADFGQVLDTFAQLGALAIEWHILDARWFGVPQRRRRVFVVAVFDPSIASKCGTQILPVLSRSEWNPPTRKSSWKNFADIPAESIGSDGTWWDGQNTAPTIGVKSCDQRMPDKNQLFTVLQPIFSFDTQFGSNAAVFEDMSPTLKGSQQSPSVTTTDLLHTVRRLTPVECERLMGWPDDHTRWTDSGKEQADTNRYKQCGNGVATPVAEWVAGHLVKLVQS